MALNGHAPPGHDHPNGSAPQIRPLKDWLETYGRDEHDAWKHDNPTQQLSYEDWKVSNHVYGPYLYYAALQVWSEPDSSDDDAKIIDVETRSRGARVQSRRGPKKTVTTNGTGSPRAAGSATPSASATAEELSASAKRKRKPRKKYLSKEIVASDDDTENVEASSFITDCATPTAPVATVNGRRKSGSRKPRKKPISEETVSPEDEEDDPMLIDQIVPPAVNSPLPVRSAPKAQSRKRSPETPKTTTPKSSIVKKTKKSFILRLPFHRWDAVDSISKSRQLAFDEDTGTGSSTRVGGTRSTEGRVTADAGEYSDADTKQSTAATSPDLNARRGLRMRRPAQQRPYFHDAQLFEDADTSPAEAGGSGSTSPASGSRRLSITPFTKTDDEGFIGALGEKIVDLEHSDESYEQRQKHFKGKGRAWKKDESDEDEEFTPKRKATKANADPQGSGQKKRGRPRKIPVSEDTVRDRSTSGADRVESAVSNRSPTATSAQPQKRARGRPRKSALSAEIVQDESSDNGSPRKKRDTVAVDAPTPPPAAPVHTPKKRGRPRKSDQNTTPVSKPSQPAEGNGVDGKGTGADDNDMASKSATATPRPTPKEPEASAPTASEAEMPAKTEADGSVETHANVSPEAQTYGSLGTPTGTSVETHVDKPGNETLEVDKSNEEKLSEENMGLTKSGSETPGVDGVDQEIMGVDEPVNKTVEVVHPAGEATEAEGPNDEAAKVDKSSDEMMETDKPDEETMAAGKPNEETKKVETTTEPVGEHAPADDDKENIASMSLNEGTVATNEEHEK